MSKVPSEISLVWIEAAITSYVSGPTATGPTPAASLILDSSLSGRHVVMAASMRRISDAAAAKASRTRDASIAGVVKAVIARCVPITCSSLSTMRCGTKTVGATVGTAGTGLEPVDGSSWQLAVRDRIAGMHLKGRARIGSQG